MYARGTLCRLLLQILERAYGDGVWDDLTMGELGKWILGGNGHMKCVCALSGKVARHRFGMSALRVSREACMWSKVCRAQAKALDTATPVEVLNAITGFEPRSPSASSHGDPATSGWPEAHQWVRNFEGNRASAK